MHNYSITHIILWTKPSEIIRGFLFKGTSAICHDIACITSCRAACRHSLGMLVPVLKKTCSYVISIPH